MVGAVALAALTAQGLAAQTTNLSDADSRLEFSCAAFPAPVSDPGLFAPSL
jgi:hypothetical protein